MTFRAIKVIQVMGVLIFLIIVCLAFQFGQMKKMRDDITTLKAYNVEVWNSINRISEADRARTKVNGIIPPVASKEN